MLHVKHTLTKPYITNDFIYMSTSLFCNIMILGGPFTAKKKRKYLWEFIGLPNYCTIA